MIGLKPAGWMLAAVGLLAANAASATCAPPPPGDRLIEGVVREAVQGDTVCIQTGPDPRRLVRLRLSDVVAPRLQGPGGEGAKWALRRAARGRRVVCAASGGSGVCRIDGVSVAALLREKRRG